LPPIGQKSFLDFSLKLLFLLIF